MALRINGNGKNGNGNGKHQRLLKLALLCLAVLVVGLLVFRQVQRLAPARATVLVASANLSAGSLVSDDDVEAADLRQSEVPPDVVEDEEQVQGRRLARSKEPGEPFRSSDFARPEPPASPSLAELLPEGRVLVRVRVAIEDVIMSELKFGDRFEILASRGGRTGVVARDAFFLAWINPRLAAPRGGNGGRDAAEGRAGLLAELLRTPTRSSGAGGISSSTALLLAVRPEDALPLAEADGGGSRVSLVLHAKSEVEKGRLVELSDSAGLAVDLIAGGRRERIQFIR